MKKDIHPDYHEVTVVLTDGTEFTTNSTYGKAGDRIQLDIDIKTHPAWTGGGAMLNKKKGKAADFNNKFGSINFSTKKKKDQQNNSDDANNAEEDKK